MPDYDDFFEQLGAHDLTCNNGGGLPMESSRGCWWGQKHHCTFCGLNGSSMAFRSKSAGRVLQEMATLSERHEEIHFTMVDNILDMKYFSDLLPALERRPAKYVLFYEAKANLTKKQLRQMKDAGIVAIQPGIESLSTDILRLMRKGITALQNIQVLKWCRELGIVPHWNLIYGFPGEQPSDYSVMASFMDALHHLEPPHGIGRVRLDRFSPNFFDAAKLGIVNVRPAKYYSHVYPLPADDLFNIAYYFDFDYADGRDPSSYVGPACDAVLRWQSNRTNKGLNFIDHDDSLAIWDFRPQSVRLLSLLDRRERAIYLFCDQHRSFSQLLSMPEVNGDGTYLASLLDSWSASRLMLGLDGHYLALAIDAGPISDAMELPGTGGHKSVDA